jgi:hypothetical protein
VLLVAPHGGRRPLVDAAAPPPNLRVNDVYTPRVTELLAARLGAATVINRELDRNTLDLNRTSQVLRRAPWFLELLAQQLDLILARHAVAEVLFVHGWNIGQPKCDLGIGAVEINGVLEVPDGATLSVNEAYFRDRIAPLRAACADAGIAVSLGARYPASHRNNLLQLFTARLPETDNVAARRIASWGAGGRLQAVQIELGIPLRWPGVWRDRFITAVSETFAMSTSQAAMPQRSVSHRSSVATAALQFYDPAADVGLLAGVGRMGPRISGGRLLLFLGGQRIALFTGEDVRGGDVAPLVFGSDDDGMQLRFSGPMLRLPDARVYLDLEAALAQSELVEADVDLRFTPSQSNEMQFGGIEGFVEIGGARRRINTGGFANAGGLRASGASRQTMLAADFGGGDGILSRITGDATRSLTLHFTADAVRTLDDVQVIVSPDGDQYTPQWFELTCATQASIRAAPQSHMAILRPVGQGRYLRVTFGVARFEWGTQQGWGLYEHAVPVGAPRSW